MVSHGPSRVISLISATLLVGLASLPAQAQSAPTLSGYQIHQTSGNTTVILSGSGFGTTASGSSVTIDNISASVLAWSNSSVTVTLPAAAGPGAIEVSTPIGNSNTMAFPGIERGYYALSAKGVVTPQGQAVSYGDLSTLSAAVSSPAIQLAVTPDNKGYWILTANGQVYPFGDATAFQDPVLGGATAVGMAVLPSGQGAYVLAQNGTVYPLGTAANYGSAPQGTDVSSISVTPDGGGYWILASNGTVYAFGDAGSYGNASITAATTVTYPSGSLLQVQKTSPVFILLNGQLHHIPNSAIFNGLGLNWSNIQSVPTLSNYQVGTPLVAPFVSGALVRPAGSPTVYLVMGGILHHIGSGSVFNAMKLNWNSVQTVSSLSPNWPVGPALDTPVPYYPSGSLVKTYSSPKVYMVNKGTLMPIASGAVFNSMNYSWSQVHWLSTLPNLPIGSSITTASRAYPTGSLIRLNNTPPVYLVQNGFLRHIPNSAALYNLGFTFSNVHAVTTLNGFTMGNTLESTQNPSPAISSVQNTAVSLAPTADGKGYWILSANGQVYNEGDAPALGNPGLSANSVASSIAPTPDGQGYLVQTTQGTFAYGDAQSFSGVSNAVSLAVTDIASANPSSPPASSSSFLSMGYGFFDVNTANGAYLDLKQNASELSAINPAWFNLKPNTSGSWSITNWTTGVNTGTSLNDVQMVTNAAHQQNVLVMPSIGNYYNPANGPISTTHDVNALVAQIVNLVTTNNFDGITIDFEDNSSYSSASKYLLPNGSWAQGSMTTAQASQQYTNFVAALGPALHAVGKKLMVAVYPSSYPYTIYNYSAIAPYVDYINVMAYPEHNSSTSAGPTAGYPWVQQIIQGALATGVNPSQFILGVAPYGHSWTYSNSAGVVPGTYITDRAVQTLLSQDQITPIWDPWQKEITFTVGYNAQGSSAAHPAVAPTVALSTADVSNTLNSVKNLQGILNYILLAYAVQKGQSTEPPLLITDGHYGPETAAAVALFQQDFNVQGASPGVYDAATQAALTAAINQYQVGSTVYWDDNSQSFQSRIGLAQQYNLGGVASWRMPFETQGYWSALANSVTVTHY